MSVTIEIPGGTAVMRNKQSELAPRRRREVEVISSRIGRVLVAITKAARLTCDGDVIEDRSAEVDEKGKPIFDGPDVELTEKQIRLMHRLNDALAWALLESWTLPLPLPASPDDMLDLPPDVFDALRLAAAKLDRELGDGGFTVDSLPEPGSDEEAPQDLPTSD